ncbi:hypothetical protein PG994_013835 [Apiospora phragmitis]|uniref:Uncharacterized protein n=1 Tax=Apiospora phragmitis TaxID=2905665 RepID=A0ABR1T2M3_9PEZI
MIGYTHNNSITAVRSFYHFLATLPRLSTEDIVNPLNEGWPDLTDAYIAPLGKNAAVCDLLRHLPYIRSNGQGNDQVVLMTRATNYYDSATRWTFDRGLVDGNLAPYGAGTVPPHLAVLTSGSRSEPARDNPDAWRAYHTRPVADFFEEWKEKYRTLDWAAVVESVDDGIMFRHDVSTDEVRQIYRDNGWPDAFNREGCEETVPA